MKTRIFMGLMFAWAAIGGLQAESPSKTVAVLYYGNTPVNSDTLHFLDAQARAAGYQIFPTQDPRQIQPEKIRAVVLLNTGLDAGIDRRLAGFIGTWEDKQRLVLVSLKKGSAAPKVEVLPASVETLGVDAVAAASRWDGRGLFGGGSDLFKMHLEWSKQVLAYVGRLP